MAVAATWDTEGHAKAPAKATDRRAAVVSTFRREREVVMAPGSPRVNSGYGFEGGEPFVAPSWRGALNRQVPQRLGVSVASVGTSATVLVALLFQ